MDESKVHMPRKKELLTYVVDGQTRHRAKRTNTVGTIEQLPSGKYRVVYHVSTKVPVDKKPKGYKTISKRYRTHAFDNKTEAERHRAGIEAQLRAGTWKPPATIEAENFQQYAKLWVQQRTTRKGEPLRPKTRSEYDRYLRQGLAYFDAYPLNLVTPALVRSWHAKRTEESGASSAGVETRVLHAILTTAMKDGVIEHNPVPSELLKTRTGIPHRAPTPGELSGIIENLPEKWRMVAYFQAYGGLRLGEFAALQRQDLQQVADNMVIHVSKQAQRVDGKWRIGDPKSAEGVRDVTLPNWLTPLVLSHLERFVGPFPKSLIFEPDVNTNGYVEASVWSHKFGRAVRAAGITAHIRPYDLRHFYGSALASSGVGVNQLKGALGHATFDSTKAYLEPVHGIGAALADRLQVPGANVVAFRKVRES